MTTAYSMFGPHAGLGMSFTKEHLRSENEAGRPFAVKFVDNAGRAAEAAQIASEFPDIPNVIVLRITKPYKIFDERYDQWDVLNHRAEPAKAGIYLVEGALKTIAREPLLDNPDLRKHIFIQFLCEDRAKRSNDPFDANFNDMHPTNYMAVAGRAAGKVLLDAGYKMTAFGFNAGEPEQEPFIEDDIEYPNAWQLPEMMTFLRWASNQDGRVAIGMNESVQDLGKGISWEDEDAVERCVPFTFASQPKLQETMALLGKDPIPVHITEWAYNFNNFPTDHAHVKRDLDFIIPLYHGLNVTAAFLWNQDGTDTVAKKSSGFIPVLQEYNRTNRWEIEDSAEPAPPPEPPVEPTPEKPPKPEPPIVTPPADPADPAPYTGCLVAVDHRHYLSQNDPRWKDIDLDGKEGGRTIGQWFCLGVAYNMLARHFKLTRMLPASFHREMQAAGGMRGETIVPGALKLMYPDEIAYDGYLTRRSEGFRDEVRKWMLAGIPVIGKVDFVTDDDRITQHWVLFIGEDTKDQLLAIDPWDGRLVNVTRRYGIEGSDIIEALWYRPNDVEKPSDKHSRGKTGGGMDMSSKDSYDMVRDVRPGAPEKPPKPEEPVVVKPPVEPPVVPRPPHPAVRPDLVLDVSEYRPNVNWQKTTCAGVYFRATIGERVDNTFHAGVHAAIQAGKAVGAYAYVQSWKPIQPQIDAFIGAIAQWQLTLPPCIDVEGTATRPAPSVEQVLQFANALAKARPRYGIYSRTTILDGLSKTERYGASFFWLAAYYEGTAPLKLPAALNGDDGTVLIHQFTDEYSTPPYIVNRALPKEKRYGVDANWANVEQLRTLQTRNLRGEPLTPIVVTPSPPPKPPAVKLDLLPYIRGNMDGTIWTIAHAGGGGERFQMQAEGDFFYLVKNIVNGQYEEFFSDNDFIYRDVDTSPGGGRYYRLKDDDLPFGSRWVPRWMAVGESYLRNPQVQFYDKASGAKSSANSGRASTGIRLVAHHASIKLKSGRTESDVVELQWDQGETYLYKNGLGLVEWRKTHQDPNSPSWSSMNGIIRPGSQEPNARERLRTIAARQVWRGSRNSVSGNIGRNTNNLFSNTNNGRVNGNKQRKMVIGINVGRHGELPDAVKQKQLLEQFFGDES